MQTYQDTEVYNWKDARDIISQVVFRNAQFQVFEKIDDTNIAWLWIKIPVVLREYDRTMPNEPYHDVNESMQAQRWDEEIYSPTYDYKVLTRPQKRVDELSGYYSIPKGLTKAELLRFVALRVASLLSHEIQENFYYSGARIFDPHIYGEFLAPAAIEKI